MGGPQPVLDHPGYRGHSLRANLAAGAEKAWNPHGNMADRRGGHRRHSPPHLNQLNFVVIMITSIPGDCL